MKVRKLLASVLLVCLLMMASAFEVFAMQIRIVVEINEYSQLPLEVSPTDRIVDVKEKIQEYTNISIKNQTLLFGGDQPLGDDLTLEDCGITEGAIVTLVGPYTVTLNMNGHGDNQTITVKYGGQLNLQEPSAEGFSFLGWYRDTNFTEEFYPQTEIFTDTMLYTKWIETHTVTLKLGGHGKDQTLTVNHGEQVVLPTPPDVEGFAFCGWYTNEGLTESFDPGIAINTNTVLYSKWIETHTVTINWDGHAKNQTLTVRHGEYVALPNPPTVEGFTFYWWYKDEGLTESFDPGVAINSDIVLYTKWYKDYTVSFDTCGIGDTVIKPRTVKYGETMELPDTPVAEGYSFDYWYWYDSEGNTYPFDQFTQFTEDVTLYAHWKLKAENTVTINSIKIHFGNYPIPDQPLTTDNIYIDAGEMTSLLELTVPSWSEWDYYAFDENRLPVQECKMSEDSESIIHFRAGKYYMYWCHIKTFEELNNNYSIEVPSVVMPIDCPLTIDCPGFMDYQCWPWMRWVDPETGEQSATGLEVAVIFQAPEYEVIEDEITDTTFEEGTDDVVTLHFNGDFALFDELVIDGNVVPKDQYTLTEGSTIVTLKSSYLETLGTGDHTVTAVYNTNMYNQDNTKDEITTVITVTKGEEKPAEQDDSTTPEESEDPDAGNEDKSAEQDNTSVPETSGTNVNVNAAPNTGDITSITSYLVSGVLSLAGIVVVNRKRRK